MARLRAERDLGGDGEIGLVIGEEFLHDRLTDQYAHHYHLIVSIFKGVALYGAANAILDIYGSGESTLVKVIATVYWVAGLTAMVGSYDGIMVGSIITTSQPNIVDIVMPFLMGVAEYTHFLSLTPLPDSPASGPVSDSAQLLHLTWWPLLFAFFSVTAVIEIATSKRALAPETPAMSGDLADLLRWYRGNLAGAQRAVAGVTAFLILAFVVLREGFPQVWLLDRLPPAETLREWQWVLGLFVIAGMLGGLLSTERARRRILDFVGSSAAADEL